VPELGCASHSYSITNRNGYTVASSGVLTDVSWARVLDDVSTASVTIQGGADCCGDLGDIRSWAMNLNIYRGDQFVWSGPITSIDWRFGETVVQAVDIIGMLDRRVPHQNFSFPSGTDLADIAEALIDDGFAPDDPGHTVTIVAPSGVKGSRTYTAGIGQTADHLRALAEVGIDFTAVGNNIVILPETFCDVIGRLSDEDLPDGLTVTEDGASLTTRWLIKGSSTSILGAAGGTDDYYGLLERYVEQTSITDQDSAQAAAEARLRASTPAPVFINTQNVTLAPTAPVDLAQLVPGWCLDITSNGTCRTVTQRLKIIGVQVSEDGGTSSNPGQESVHVQVAASGAESGVAVLGA
jgi:hypothetical protein